LCPFKHSSTYPKIGEEKTITAFSLTVIFIWIKWITTPWHSIDLSVYWSMLQYSLLSN
jgi:hypothetical protein